jgi:flagellin-like hook-associated protein FlgL
MTLVDVNNDSKLDAVLGYRSGLIYYVMIGNGDGTFQPRISCDANGSVDSVEYGDFNNDGNIDLAFDSDVTSATPILRIALGNGDGTYKSTSTVFSGGDSGFNSIAVRDINGDGNDDLVRAGAGRIEFYLGNGNGTFKASTSVAVQNSTPQHLEMEDLNGDGVDDIVIANIVGTATALLSNVTYTGGLPDFDLLTTTTARAALDQMHTNLSTLSSVRGRIGSVESRLQSALSNLMTSRSNAAAAESQIRDADVATEAAELVRLQILQQAGAQILGQTNLQPQMALRLLRG